MSSEHSPTRKSHKGIILLLIILIAAVGGGIFWYLQPEQSAELVREARTQIDTLVGQTPLGSVLGSQQESTPTSAATQAQTPQQTAPETPVIVPQDNSRELMEKALAENDVAPAVPPASADSAGSPASADQVKEKTPPAASGGKDDPNLVIQPREGVAPLVLQTTPPAGTTQDWNEPVPPASAQVDKALKEPVRPLSPEESAGLPSTGGKLSGDAPRASDGRQDDGVVTLTFIENLAEWLVSSYEPSANGGSSPVTLVAANRRYGLNLTGLRHENRNPAQSRKAILGYVYSPGMLEGLYNLYADRFLYYMGKAANLPRNGRPALSREETAFMYAYYARRFQQSANALRGMAAAPDLRARVLAWQAERQQLADAKAAFGQLVLDFEAARNANNNALMEQLRTRMEAQTKANQAAEHRRDEARKALELVLMPQSQSSALPADDIVYLAEWIARRNPETVSESTATAAMLFADMAGRFGQVVKTLTE